MGAALERYRLATSAPRTAGGFRSRWRRVEGVDLHDRVSLANPDSPSPVVMVHGLADRVRGLVLVGPTIDPAARTATRQILRWLRDTAREDPLQLPILLRDVRDAGPHRVAGP